jgi:type VI protein secretion system component VasF
MQPSIARLVEPVFDRTLRLRESVALGNADDLLATRDELKELLNRVRSGEDRMNRQRSNDYLGLSYPLACWIDEIMTADATVGVTWNEMKLEGSLFGTNDRAWMFWRQSELAETMGFEDDVAVFYLCASFGFSGQYSNDPDKLSGWMQRCRLSLGVVPDLRLPFASDLAPMTDVPPLLGTRRLRHASHVAWTSAVVLLPVMSYLIVTSWTR